MTRRRDVLLLGAVGLAATAAGTVLGPVVLQSQSGAADLASAAYPDPSGRVWRLATWHGKVLICNFWATWCEPCRVEIPLLVSIRGRYASKGGEVVGIGIDQAIKIRRFANEFSVPYP